MIEEENNTMSGRHVLVVEDDYLIAIDLAQYLEDLGIVVVGPAGSVADALVLVQGQSALDAAILDVNLGDGERVFPVAAALRERGVPFVFATGYDERIIPSTYADVPRFEKPVDAGAVARTFLK